ncbi:MAG: diacylglycerol kinase family protein [Polyangiaceae bacterium]
MATSPTTTHLLVANPTAQSGKNAERVAKAQRLLTEAGLKVEMMPTEPAGRTTEKVRRALDSGQYGCVIAMGGDGTFREVASGIMLSTRRDEIALGMLPTGTANDQGRSFGLDPSEESIARNVLVIRGHHETRLDAGHIVGLDVHGRKLAEAYFFDSAGWGLSARILADRNEDRKVVEQIPGLRHVYRDQAIYAGALVKNLLGSYVTSDKFVAHVESEGGLTTLTRLSDLVIKATRIYGGAWVFDPTSKHDDGLFEVVPARGRRDWFARVAKAAEKPLVPGDALDALGIEPSEIFRSGRLHLKFEVPPGNASLAAQIDGEEFPATPQVRIEVLPRALRLIVPIA